MRTTVAYAMNRSNRTPGPTKGYKIFRRNSTSISAPGAHVPEGALPARLIYGFGLALPVLETVIGAAVAMGFRTRASLFAGALLMLVLTFGSVLRQDWPTVGIQLTYSFVYCALIAGAHFDGYCLDRLLDRRV